jgi:hypothetical protein
MLFSERLNKDDCALDRTRNLFCRRVPCVIYTPGHYVSRRWQNVEGVRINQQEWVHDVPLLALCRLMGAPILYPSHPRCDSTCLSRTPIYEQYQLFRIIFGTVCHTATRLSFRHSTHFLPASYAATWILCTRIATRRKPQICVFRTPTSQVYVIGMPVYF